MKKRSTDKGKTRFTMRLDTHMLEQLEKLQALTGKGSVADVVREAVAIYGELVTASQRGVRFSFDDRKGGESGHIWLLPGGSPFTSK